MQYLMTKFSIFHVIFNNMKNETFFLQDSIGSSISQLYTEE